MGTIISFLAGIFGYLLNFIYSYVNNYGIAIILFTIAVQIILLPFTIRQQKTMIKNNKIQAKVKELQEKYKNDPSKTKISEIIRRETRPFTNGFLILYPIGQAGRLTDERGDHKPPFGFAAVFPDRKGKGDLKSYRMNDIALEKDSNEFYG